MVEGQVDADRHGFLLDEESCNGSCFVIPEDKSRSCIDTTDPVNLRAHIKRGLTANERGSVWESVLKAKETKTKHDDFSYEECIHCLYDKLELSAEINIKEIIAKLDTKITNGGSNFFRTTRQILMDIDRTYPNHHLFVNGSENQVKLFRILSAYSQFDTSIGYCQGMAYVVGLLLMYINDEETVFWCFTYLLNSENHLHNVYEASLNKVKVMSELLTLLIERNSPQLSKHMSDMGVHGLMYSVQWFMCLFTGINCWDAVLLIADLFFTEGIHHLFNAAMTIVQNCVAELMVLSTLSEALPFLQNIPYRLVHRGQLKSSLFSNALLSASAFDKYWPVAVKRVEEEEKGTLSKRRHKRKRSPTSDDSKQVFNSAGPKILSRLANFLTPAKRQRTNENDEHRAIPDTPSIASPPPPFTLKNQITKGYYTPDTGLVYTSPNTIEMKRITGLCTAASDYSEAKRLFNDSPVVHSPLVSNVVLASGGERRSPRIAKRRLREKQITDLLNSPL